MVNFRTRTHAHTLFTLLLKLIQLMEMNLCKLTSSDFIHSKSQKIIRTRDFLHNLQFLS